MLYNRVFTFDLVADGASTADSADMMLDSNDSTDAQVKFDQISRIIERESGVEVNDTAGFFALRNLFYDVIKNSVSVKANKFNFEVNIDDQEIRIAFYDNNPNAFDEKFLSNFSTVGAERILSGIMQPYPLDKVISSKSGKSGEKGGRGICLSQINAMVHDFEQGNPSAGLRVARVDGVNRFEITTSLKTYSEDRVSQATAQLDVKAGSMRFGSPSEGGPVKFDSMSDIMTRLMERRARTQSAEKSPVSPSQSSPVNFSSKPVEQSSDGAANPGIEIKVIKPSPERPKRKSVDEIEQDALPSNKRPSGP